jgi:hypothetical protein
VNFSFFLVQRFDSAEVAISAQPAQCLAHLPAAFAA